MFKKIRYSLTAFILCLAVLFSAFSVYADSYSYYVTPTSTTQLYYSADVNSYSYGTVSVGDVMGVKSTSGDFYYVYVGGRYGYVLKSYCTSTTSTSITQPSQSISKYLSTTTGTFLFSGAYSNSTMIMSIPAGSSVAIVNTSGDYYYVYYNNQYGYIPVSAFGTTSTYGTVTSVNSVGLYSSAGLTGTMYTVIPSGKTLSVISTSGIYYYLSYNGFTGYALMSAFTTAGSNAFSTSTYNGTVSTTPISNADGAVAYGTVSPGSALLKTAGGVTTATFPSGGQVGIISKTSSGYYYISANGYKGYVAASSVTLSGTANIPVSDSAATISTASAPSGGKSATIYRCKTNVNMREQPSSSATLIGAVPKGANITAYGKSGSYTQISYNGTVGYVLSKYVKK